MSTIVEHEQIARAYLSQELGADAPRELTLAGSFDEAPLEEEGRTSIFAFTASRGGNPAESFFVVSGETEPNYYPAWDLDPEEIYSLHIGTRFMLVMEVSQLGLEAVPDTLESDVLAALAEVAPEEPVQDFRPVAVFELEDTVHVVCRMRIREEEVYLLAGDLPLGVYRRTDLPPHVIYRMHLGNVIRMEHEEPD
jgi:hypothetical protein